MVERDPLQKFLGNLLHVARKSPASLELSMFSQRVLIPNELMRATLLNIIRTRYVRSCSLSTLLSKLHLFHEHGL